MQTLLLLQPVAQQEQSMYAEMEDQQRNSFGAFCLHPQHVAVSRQHHIDGGEHLFCQLEGLAVLQQDRGTLD